jgi:hypothetical protein
VGAPEDIRLLFQGMFERFLKRHDVTIARYPKVECLNCHEVQERNVVKKQIERGRDHQYCTNCGEKVSVPIKDEIYALPKRSRERLDQEQDIAKRRTNYESALVWIKSLLRERKKDNIRPSCFISYAWGSANQEKWVNTFARDLIA